MFWRGVKAMMKRNLGYGQWGGGGQLLFVGAAGGYSLLELWLPTAPLALFGLWLGFLVVAAMVTGLGTFQHEQHREGWRFTELLPVSRCQLWTACVLSGLMPLGAVWLGSCWHRLLGFVPVLNGHGDEPAQTLFMLFSLHHRWEMPLALAAALWFVFSIGVFCRVAWRQDVQLVVALCPVVMGLCFLHLSLRDTLGVQLALVDLAPILFLAGTLLFTASGLLLVWLPPDWPAWRRLLLGVLPTILLVTGVSAGLGIQAAPGWQRFSFRDYGWRVQGRSDQNSRQNQLAPLLWGLSPRSGTHTLVIHGATGAWQELGRQAEPIRACPLAPGQTPRETTHNYLFWHAFKRTSGGHPPAAQLWRLDLNAMELPPRLLSNVNESEGDAIINGLPWAWSEAAGLLVALERDQAGGGSRAGRPSPPPATASATSPTPTYRLALRNAEGVCRRTLPVRGTCQLLTPEGWLLLDTGAAAPEAAYALTLGAPDSAAALSGSYRLLNLITNEERTFQLDGYPLAFDPEFTRAVVLRSQGDGEAMEQHLLRADLRTGQETELLAPADFRHAYPGRWGEIRRNSQRDSSFMFRSSDDSSTGRPLFQASNFDVSRAVDKAVWYVTRLEGDELVREVFLLDVTQATRRLLVPATRLPRQNALGLASAESSKQLIRYGLSPDGGTLAFAIGNALSLVDTTTGAERCYPPPFAHTMDASNPSQGYRPRVNQYYGNGFTLSPDFAHVLLGCSIDVVGRQDREGYGMDAGTAYSLLENGHWRLLYRSERRSGGATWTDARHLLLWDGPRLLLLDVQSQGQPQQLFPPPGIATSAADTNIRSRGLGCD